MTHTLEFLQGQIHYTLIEGQWWFHVKSICEALKVDYVRQKRNITSSFMLADGGQTMSLRIGDDQSRKHFMINERRVAAWLFQVKSESAELKAFQLELADKIYEITKGQLVPISAAAVARREAEQKVAQLEQKLSQNEDYRMLMAAKAQLRAASKQLNNAASKQADLFTSVDENLNTYLN